MISNTFLQIAEDAPGRILTSDDVGDGLRTPGGASRGGPVQRAERRIRPGSGADRYSGSWECSMSSKLRPPARSKLDEVWTGSPLLQASTMTRRMCPFLVLVIDPWRWLN